MKRTSPLAGRHGGLLKGSKKMSVWDTLDGICNRYTCEGSRVSVLLKPLQSGKVLYSRNPEWEMKSASTIKVLILLACLDALGAENGERIRLDEMIHVKPSDRVPYSLVTLLDTEQWLLGDLLKLMIATSDNTATNLVIKRIGFSAVNELAQKMGMEQTHLRRLMMDTEAAARGEENTISLLDLCRLYEKLWCSSRGEADNNADQKPASMAFDMLKNVADSSMLLRFFSEDECPLSHKTGGLPDVHHDAGIFHADCGDYFFGVFTAEMPEPVSKELIGALSRAVYDSRGEWFV